MYVIDVFILKKGNIRIRARVHKERLTRLSLEGRDRLKGSMDSAPSQQGIFWTGSV